MENTEQYLTVEQLDRMARKFERYAEVIRTQASLQAANHFDSIPVTPHHFEFEVRNMVQWVLTTVEEKDENDLDKVELPW